MIYKYLPLLLLSFTLITTSCSDDDDDDDKQTTPVAGDYFPLVTNSVWNYSTSGGQQFDIKATGRTSIVNGSTYLALAPSSGDPSFYQRLGGDYYVKDPRIQDAYIFLKDNVEVGTSWSFQSVKDNEIDQEVVLTVTEINSSKEVGENTYTDVIKVEQEIRTNKVDGEFDEGYIEEYYYARGIGLVFSKNRVIETSLISHAIAEE